VIWMTRWMLLITIQVFGTTVYGYLHDYRLEQAQHLLELGQLSVAEVVRSMGFRDRQHVAAAFKKMYGLPPRDYCRAGRSRA
jgi:AraC family transcriptional regulator, transcriptional activator of the genes for pyochelin and ferripyochelin receptors